MIMVRLGTIQVTSMIGHNDEIMYTLWPLAFCAHSFYALPIMTL